MINSGVFNAFANKAIAMKRNIIRRIKYSPLKRERYISGRIISHTCFLFGKPINLPLNLARYTSET